MKTALFKQTLTDYKNKLFSTIGTFTIFAALYLVILIPCILLTGYKGSHMEFFDYLNNPANSFDAITPFITMAFAVAFFIIHGIRNNYRTSLPLSSSRDTYMISDIALAPTYGIMFAMVQILAESIMRFTMGNGAGQYTFKQPYDYSITMIFQNAAISIFLIMALYYIVSAIINCIVRKKYHMILINIAIIIVYVVIVTCPNMLSPVSSSFKSFQDSYLDFLSSWWGITILLIGFSAIFQPVNYIYIRKGGFRR